MSRGPTAGRRGPRVLVVVQNMNLRFDRRVRHEARALLDAGIGVTVVCPKATPDEPDRWELDGVVVRSYPDQGTTSGLLSYMREFLVAWLHTARLSRRVHRDEGFDVLQACNPPDTYWLLGLLWRLRGKRFVYDQHDLNPEVYVDRFGDRGLRNRVLHRALLWLERATYRTAQHVISPNESYREIALTRGRVPPERTTVVMSTPDPEVLRRGDPVPGGRGDARHLVAYVGIMGPQDGVDRLLRAAKILADTGRTDIRFVVMGYGDCYDDLVALASSLGLGPTVQFTGRVDPGELRAWLSTADLGVTPDPRTPFTDRSTMNKTLEYMACELPVVASDLKETRRSAEDAAVYVTTEAEMAEAIARLLDDPVRRAEMGAAGRKRIEGALRWDRFAADYVAAVRSVLP